MFGNVRTIVLSNYSVYYFVALPWPQGLCSVGSGAAESRWREWYWWETERWVEKPCNRTKKNKPFFFLNQCFTNWCNHKWKNKYGKCQLLFSTSSLFSTTTWTCTHKCHFYAAKKKNYVHVHRWQWRHQARRHLGWKCLLWWDESVFHIFFGGEFSAISAGSKTKRTIQLSETRLCDDSVFGIKVIYTSMAALMQRL